MVVSRAKKYILHGAKNSGCSSKKRKNRGLSVARIFYRFRHKKIVLTPISRQITTRPNSLSFMIMDLNTQKWTRCFAKLLHRKIGKSETLSKNYKFCDNKEICLIKNRNVCRYLSEKKGFLRDFLSFTLGKNRGNKCEFLPFANCRQKRSMSILVVILGRILFTPFRKHMIWHLGSGISYLQKRVHCSATVVNNTHFYRLKGSTRTEEEDGAQLYSEALRERSGTG